MRQPLKTFGNDSSKHYEVIKQTMNIRFFSKELIMIKVYNVDFKFNCVNLS
jgi:hypothetical protein